MRTKLQRCAYNIQKCLDSIYLLFIFITLYFAVTSTNLNLRSNSGDEFIGIGTTWVSIVFLLIIIAIVLAFAVNQTFRTLWRRVFIHHGVLVATIMVVLALLWQLIVILQTHPAIGFDPGAIHEALTQTSSANIRSYYSYNTNNLSLLLIQHEIAKVMHNTSWLMFDLVNWLLLIGTVLVNMTTVWFVDKRKLAIGLYTHAVWLMLFPMVLVPYSDIYVLPFVALLILCYVIISTTKWHIVLKVGISIIAGLTLSGIYFLKPSAMIPIIAIFVVEFLHILITRNNNQKIMLMKILVVTVFLLTAGFSYQLGNKVLQNQTYMVIQKNRTLPPIHFISMGVSGDGGYNAQDVLAMAKQPSQAAMSRYSKDKLVERLQQKGFIGYLIFLVHKQDKNTSDGTFAWLKEGRFIIDKPAKNGVKSVIQNIIYPSGHYLSDFHFIAQFWWVMCIGIISLGWRQKDRLTAVLRLAIVGGFLYLLIFEGGRSRYIIQFLPIFLLLTVFVWPQTVALIQEKLSWLNVNKKNM